MANVTICDECEKIIRKEFEECLADEIKYVHKKYHIGAGMSLPVRVIEGTFCSKKCFKEWYERNEQG